MATKAKRGGARNGAGRKKVKDKKKAVFIYVRKSIIKANGGEDKAKAFAEAALQENAQVLQK